MIECTTLFLRGREIELPSGIYVLVKNGGIAYVGLTTGLMNRLKDHRRKKEFDTILFFPCHETILRAVESRLIAILKPPLNLRRNASLKPTNRGAIVTAESRLVLRDLRTIDHSQLAVDQKPITVLGLPYRIERILVSNGTTTVGTLLRLGVNAILNFRGIGSDAIGLIELALAKLGIAWNDH